MKLYMQAGPEAGMRALKNTAWPARAFEIAGPALQTQKSTKAREPLKPVRNTTKA